MESNIILTLKYYNNILYNNNSRIYIKIAKDNF